MAEAYQEASGAAAQQAQAAQLVVSERDVVMWLHEHGPDGVVLSQLTKHFQAKFPSFSDREKNYH